MDNIIGIGGIFATIVGSILSCVVTWIVSKHTQRIMQLSWSADISKVLNINSDVNAGEIQLFHDGVEIKNPHIVQMQIKNTGNVAINFPGILVRCYNSDKIIPSGFRDVPFGYEDKWKLEIINEKECEIKLEHINPKQVVSVILFLDGNNPEIEVSCPMKDLVLKEPKNEKPGIFPSVFTDIFFSEDPNYFYAFLIGLILFILILFIFS